MIRLSQNSTVDLFSGVDLESVIDIENVVIKEMHRRSLYEFIKYFWSLISEDEFHGNWHIEFLCKELEYIANRVGNRMPKEYDLIVNIPPGLTKTTLMSVMFPVWCWVQWPWMRFIAASYSEKLSLESAEMAREIIRSKKFREIYPEIDIKRDKDTKSNYRIIVKKPGSDEFDIGGNRFSTSVGGTLTGFHGDIIIVDDPLNPHQASSEVELNNANRWMDLTLSTRKTNKAVSTMILIMQRLHEHDVTGYLLSKQKKNIKHISLPGEIRNFVDSIKPASWAEYYKNDLLEPVRLSWEVLEDLKADLGQYGYSGQIGQNPVPPGGGMFKVDNFVIIDSLNDVAPVVKSVRYWDKAASEGKNAYTVGVRMHLLKDNKWLIDDVVRGRWSTERRERIILNTAIGDGNGVMIWMEQEAGSGGKESAENTIRNLAGFSAYAERTTGDKVYRADPYSVQVNNGNVYLLRGAWNHDFIEEHRYFPFSTWKDQVDAAAGAFNHLVPKRTVRRIC